MSSDADRESTLEISRASVSTRRFSLEVIAGPDTGATYESRGPRTVIGTHRSSDVRLSDPTVSRFHCQIEILDGVPLISDLESQNETFVSDVSILRARLHDDTILAIGHTKIRFSLGKKHTVLRQSRRSRMGDLVGSSPLMRALFAELESAAVSDLGVLLEGETGTGKDLAAHAIHQASSRRDRPFVVVDCGAVTPTLIQGQLFGHERGAFTGADTDRAGAFEAASGGTVMLDEIGELPLELQPVLLRVLESGEIRRIGGSAVSLVDVRVIAATNRNLRELVNAGKFRSDLFYRLAVINIELPPLRRHLDDLPPLVAALLSGVGATAEVAAALQTEDSLARMAQHPWRGNVRELRNYLERCVAFREEQPLSAEGGDERQYPAVDIDVPLQRARERWISYYEPRYLESLLREVDGNVSAAARAAGVSRGLMHRLLVRYNMKRTHTS